VTSAWEGNFEDFVGFAIGGRLPSYAAFFDAGGPAWANTRIVHFADVEAGLTRACREFGLDVAVQLPRKNCGVAEDHGLVVSKRIADSVRHHFAWYHATFGHADHPAARRRPPARLAA
jgi:hypothetical protein